MAKCKYCGHEIVKFLNWSQPKRGLFKSIWWHSDDLWDRITCQIPDCKCVNPEPEAKGD